MRNRYDGKTLNYEILKNFAILQFSIFNVTILISASKGVQQGCIFLWDYVPNVLHGKSRKNKPYTIVPHACLKWQDTEEEYIFCRAARGELVSEIGLKFML